MSRDERGFTLMEMLVVLGILSVVSVGFYQLLISGTRGSDVTRSVVRISEEARLGLNRMIRDTREAVTFTSTTSTGYTILVDFDRDGTPDPNPTPSPGIHPEIATYEYDAATSTITLNDQVLATGVEQIGGQPIFSYTSNSLEYDTDGNGVTDGSEIDEAEGIGNVNGVIDLPGERALVTGVVYAFQVRVDDAVTEFYAETQLRNRRSGE